MSTLPLNADFLDLLREFGDAGAEFLIVGAHALAVNGVPRSTGDLDVLVRPTATNAARVYAALERFGAPLSQHSMTVADLAREGTVYQMGLPPSRIDVLTSITAVSFDEAWAGRRQVDVQGRSVAFLGREALLKNKRATGRPKDLADVHALESGE